MDIETIRKYRNRPFAYGQVETRTHIDFLLTTVERLEAALIRSTFVDAANREELDQQRALAKQLAKALRQHRHVGICDAACPFAAALAAYEAGLKEEQPSDPYRNVRTIDAQK